MEIAIAGYGLEGKANLEYFRAKFPEANFTIFDKNTALDDVPTGVKTVLGDDAFDQIKGFDLVLRTPGLPPRQIAQADKHWSSTREFFAECAQKKIPIIGVTGSKGKGTTASFIAEILRAAGKKVHLLGNIGVPALEILPQIKPGDLVVYELSSFQLWDLEMSPHIAVMTLIEPDHLDVHANFAEYTEAKSHIIAFQTDGDVAVYNASDALVKEMVETATKQTKAAPIPFLNKKFVHIEQVKNVKSCHPELVSGSSLSSSSSDLGPAESSKKIDSRVKHENDENNKKDSSTTVGMTDYFYYDNIEICPTSVVKLPGEHNLRNAAAAISATWNLINGDTTAVAKGLANFHGLPHRLKFVREVGGVKFYDDSVATTPGSAIAAVKAFDEPKILIVGGYDKGADYHQLGQAIEQSNVRQIFVIGANRTKVAEQIGAETSTPIHQLDNQKLSDIVQIVNQATEPGDVVTLSPAAASFDMFRDYQDRGEQFIAAVEALPDPASEEAQC